HRSKLRLLSVCIFRDLQAIAAQPGSLSRLKNPNSRSQEQKSDQCAYTEVLTLNLCILLATTLGLTKKYLMGFIACQPY
ncbi:hypothetical protein DL93DRAFT_2079714, partial [Clavulina sp. PMI_390]